MRSVRRPVLVVAFILAALAWPHTACAQSGDTLRPPFGDARARRHYPRTRAFDLEHVKAELSFDWQKQEVAGTATLTLTPINDGLARIELDAAEMTIEQVTLAGPTPIAGLRPASGQQLKFDYSGERLSITLDRPYTSSERIELAIRYRTRPRKGLYFKGPDAAYPNRPRQLWTQGESEDNRYWIPLYDFPNDRATSELIATVPAEMTAISNGRLLETREDRSAATKTYHWREDVPHVTYLISLIVGRFDRHTESVDGIPLDYYVPPGTDKATVARSFDQTAAMLRFFSDYTGVPYPYEKYAQTTVEEGLFGGMENISATTLYTDTLHDEAAAPNWSSEGLVAHEFAHQWWGDWVTCRDWSHIWLNEGFATFFTNLWYEHRYGRAEYDYRRWEHANDLPQQKAYFEEDSEDYRRPIVWPIYVHQDDLFDSHTYPKGALVLDMLRYVLGDELFQKSFRHYGRKFARQVADTDDFRKAIAEATGQELGWFFDEWLHRAGHPEFQVESEWDPETRTVHLRVEQKQELKEMTPIFRMPIEVEFVTSAGPQRFRAEVAHPRDDFYFPLPERPTRVRFDPDQRIVKTLAFPKSREELLDLLQNDSNVQGRIWAAEQLGQRSNDLVAVAALGEALKKDSFWGVRREIARVLGETKQAVARDPLLAGLADPDPRVREKAAEALSEFQGDTTVAGALEKVIGQEPKTYVVAAAVKALGKTRAPKAFETLRAALARNSHRDVIRRGAYDGLAALGDARAFALVLEGTGYGQPPRAREAAIEALGKLGRGNDQALNQLLALVNDPYIWARRSALKALGELGDERALPALEAVASTDPERRTAREAERAIEKIRRTQAARKP